LSILGEGVGDLPIPRRNLFNPVTKFEDDLALLGSLEKALLEALDERGPGTQTR
jgi:hypothetical protein